MREERKIEIFHCKRGMCCLSRTASVFSQKNERKRIIFAITAINYEWAKINHFIANISITEAVMWCMYIVHMYTAHIFSVIYVIELMTIKCVWWWCKPATIRNTWLANQKKTKRLDYYIVAVRRKHVRFSHSNHSFLLGVFSLLLLTIGGCTMYIWKQFKNISTYKSIFVFVPIFIGLACLFS